MGFTLPVGREWSVKVEKSLKSQPPEPPGSDAEIQLLNICRKLMKIDSLGIHDDLFAMGLDSSTLVQFYSHINQQYPNRLELQDLFDNRSIHKLSGLVVERNYPRPTGKQNKKLKEVEF